MAKSADSTVRRSRWRRALLAVLPCAMACSGRDPASELERASSWASTTRELAIERSVSAVGRRYTADLLDAGRRQVEKIAGSLQPSALPETLRARTPAAVTRLDSVMLQAAGAVRRGDPVALASAAASADSLGSALRALREALGGR